MGEVDFHEAATLRNCLCIPSLRSVLRSGVRPENMEIERHGDMGVLGRDSGVPSTGTRHRELKSSEFY